MPRRMYDVERVACPEGPAGGVAMTCLNCHREIAESSNFCYFCGARQTVAAARPAGAPKRLMRSSTNNKIAGICGGLGEYMDADPTIIRLVLVLVVFFTGIFPGVVAYLLGWMIIPLAPEPASAPSAVHATQATQHS